VLLLPAVLGGIAGAVVSVLLPPLLGAARQRVPSWFGFVRIAYVRTVAAGIFGLTAATAISISTDDHSHRAVTYIVWYVAAACALIVIVAATIVIDRSLARNPMPSGSPSEITRSARTDSKLRLRRLSPPASIELNGAMLHQPETGGPLPVLTPLEDSPLSGPPRTDPVMGASVAQQESERLAAHYKEGEQLRASISLSTSFIPDDIVWGTANQRQVQRERLARDWDARVLAVLPDDARSRWIAVSTLPAAPQPRLIEPTTTIRRITEFLTAKLDCLKEIICQLEVNR
jgi:hypothetical protein